MTGTDSITSPSAAPSAAESGYTRLRLRTNDEICTPHRIVGDVQNRLEMIGVGVDQGRVRKVRPSGLEPETSRLEGGCSVQLSYGRIVPIFVGDSLADKG